MNVHLSHNAPSQGTSPERTGLARFRHAGLLALAGALMAFGVNAQALSANGKPEGPVQIEMTQHLVVMESGKETFRPADKVKPGDLIEYRASYVNRSDKPVERFVTTLPIPVGLEYVPRSAMPSTPAAQVALLDGRYAAEPLMRAVPGKAEPEVVPHAEYRSVRWELKGVPARGRGQVSVRARVSSAPVDVQATSTGALLKAVKPRTP